MQAIVLAGGKGQRLLPHTIELPKPLMPLDDRSVLEHLLQRMKESGVTRVCLAVNHLAEMIENLVGDGSAFGLEVTYTRETAPLSTVAPLKLVDNLDDSFLVVNGDILTDIDFSEVFTAHAQSSCELTVVTSKRHGIIDYGVIETDADDRITDFKEKPSFDYKVSCGIYCFTKSILSLVPDNQPFGFDQLVLLMLAENKPINTFLFDGYWLDIGRPDDYARAKEDLERLKNQC